MESIARNRPPYRSILLRRYTKRRGQELTEAECSAHTSPNHKLMSVYSQNSATGEYNYE